MKAELVAWHDSLKKNYGLYYWKLGRYENLPWDKDVFVEALQDLFDEDTQAVMAVLESIVRAVRIEDVEDALDML